MDRTIMMIHGMWGGAWCWEYFKPFFEDKGYHCVTPILRYHDMDPNDEPDFRLGSVSLTDYADDLEKQIRDLGEPVILMGHSMGGLLSQILASRGVAEAAVLLTPAAPYGIMGLTPSVIRSFWSILTVWKFWQKPGRQTFKEASFSTLGVLSADMQEKEFGKFVYESGRVIFEIGLWPMDLKQSSKVDESKVNCPVLIIAGSEDKITPASVVRKVANKYQKVALYREFEQHGHAVLQEPGWEDIAGHTLDWLNKVLDSEKSEAAVQVEQRKFKRNQFDAVIAFANSESDSYYPGNIEDYSSGGLHFTSKIEVKPGSDIIIKWSDRMPDIETLHAKNKCRAEVIWYKQSKDGSLFDIGAKFSESNSP